MENKYKEINNNYFGFEVFEEILKVIGERKGTAPDTMFDAGVESADGAVRRLREEYYESIKLQHESKD